MLELLFLLLPIAAGYGWYMGRRSIRHKDKSERKKLSRDYFTGLNFLLSNESDKAVDLFISLLDVDDETIDTHLSLGSLFRKRGEVDRSIRIHQNLIARPSLSTEQRDIAMMELGKDYHAAGLYDRAEEILIKLVQQQDHSESAEVHLIDIYQITKEWQKAISLIKSLKRKRQQFFQLQLTHFYCELANETSDEQLIIKYLQAALKQDERCGRAQLELASHYLKLSDIKGTEKLLKQLINNDISLFTEALPIAKALYADDVYSFIALLNKAIEAGAGASVIITLAKQLIELNQIKEAEKLILSSLYKQPTMKSFQQLMQLQLLQAEDGQAKESLIMLQKMVEQQIRIRPSFRCSECGFPSHTLYWLCPSCKQWASIKRIKGLDGE